MIIMWLKVITCILDSNEFRVRLGPVFKGCYQRPSFLLSLCSAFHTFSSMLRLHSEVSSVPDIYDKKGSLWSHTPHPPTKNSSGKEIKSLVTPVKSKRLLLKKKIFFFLIQQKSLHISSVGLCSHTWTNFPGQETGLDLLAQPWNSGGINSSEVEEVDFHRKLVGICIKK